ncbi:MAG: Unknown protein [uncultured Sulfurovum sp.]|uniref:PIN domain-containing protein n=1 Tax=uncultured Sulfurovum sp. TaxID=269237 RepID=A0A6S6SPE8_9BACT|nr:MAG: Unknown protein [uncultured Sulfurovum sp.]
MKIVIDTDVFLSSLFSKQGASHKLITWIAKEYQKNEKRYNVISNTQVIEFSAVFTRDKNLQRANLTKSDVESFINAICLISSHQKINFLWRPFLKDKDDDMVLEVAFNGNADYIITHNLKDFKGVEENFEIKVLTPKEFLINIGELQ